MAPQAIAAWRAQVEASPPGGVVMVPRDVMLALLDAAGGR